MRRETAVFYSSLLTPHSSLLTPHIIRALGWLVPAAAAARAATRMTAAARPPAGMTSGQRAPAGRRALRRAGAL